MTLYHYDVYLRASHGTVKRMVSVNKRSTKLAGENAALAVARTVKEPVKVLDVVPLRCVRGKVADNGRRGRKAGTIQKVRFVQTRRPKARASLKLSRKGKLYEPKWAHSEEGAHYQPKKVSEHLSEREAPPRTCESAACKARGSCTHDFPPKGKFFLVLIEVTKRSKGKVVIREGHVWVQNAVVSNRLQAAAFAVEFIKGRTDVSTVKVLETFTEAAARKQLTTRAGVVSPRSYFRR